jgi:hypothetical protein
MSELDASFEKLLGRQPTDTDRKQLYQVRDALGLKNNDALWLVLMALQSYDERYKAIPAQISTAAKDSAASAAAQAQAQINSAVAALVPSVEKAVERGAAGAVKRIQFGKSMFSIWLGMLALGAAVALGWVLGAGIYTGAENHHITWTDFWHLCAWGIGIGTASPMLILIGGLDLSGDDKTAWWQWLAMLAGAGGAILLALNFLGLVH